MIKEILSAIPTFSKYQLVLLAIMVVNVVFQSTVVARSWKKSRVYSDQSEKIFQRACEIKLELDSVVVFRDTTFCACESCKNRECPRKLTRLVIADAVRMGVPVRMDNFMDDCSGYTEVDEE